MFTQRHTAYKLRIKDLTSNEYVLRNGESDYITVNGKEVSRTRIVATVVNKFTNEERKSGTLIIDDCSDIISVRAWENEYHLIDKINIGDLIEVIGRVRKYNDNVYLTPEIIKKISPNEYVLWKVELGKTKEKSTDSDLKSKILNKIQESGEEGTIMEELIKIAGDKATCQQVLKELLEEGTIFEPKAGKYKAIT